MSKKNKNKNPFSALDGLVFSTNPEFTGWEGEEEESEESLPAKQQRLRVMIDRKKRKGKEVTLVTGFEGTEDDLKALGKLLKTKCGVGGSVKDGEILIQGNQREKVVKLLKEEGYTGTKAAGG